jgi:hypothetical protein
MAFSRKLDKRDFRKQWNTFSPNQLQNTGDDLPPPKKLPFPQRMKIGLSPI